MSSIVIRLEKSPDHKIVEALVRAAFDNPYCMAMELQPGYLEDAASGTFVEADIYNDDLNCEQAKSFDLTFSQDKATP